MYPVYVRKTAYLPCKGLTVFFEMETIPGMTMLQNIQIMNCLLTAVFLVIKNVSGV
jgi:hypothetical protein